MNGHGKFPADCPELRSTFADGMGKCIPAIEKQINTDRAVCGPYRKRPPEKVTSEMTFRLPPVDPNDLIARLYYTSSRQVPMSAGKTVLCFKKPTPYQIRKDKESQIPPLEPLVASYLYYFVYLFLFCHIGT